jgi:tetratricopeptide (TPR) repeat protein
MTGAGIAPCGGATAGTCPYRALEAFREEHSGLFFGRDAFAAELLDRVLHRPLVALVGPSGSGKSSVIQAGLIPRLRRQRPPQRAWDAVVFRPGDEPFHRLAAALAPLLEPGADEVDRLASARKLGDRLADGSVPLADVVERLIAKSNGTDRLLIVADQFEELFTLATPPQRQPFVAAVLGALDRAPFTFLVALRADFYGHAIALDRGFSDRIQAGLVNLGPMTRGELRSAIEQPAAKVGATFETGLVDRVLGRLESQPGSLPLLEFALTQLWERRDGHRIVHAAYEAIGGVEGAVSQRAEAVFLGLGNAERQAALSLFTRLVRVSPPGEREPDTRRRVALDDLTAAERSVLRSFVDARLLVLDRGEATGRQTLEVAHEALIQGWRRLADWVGERREFLLWRQRLAQSLAEWDRTGRDKDALLRGPALKEAVAWVRRKADLSDAENEYIGFSRTRKRRAHRWLAAAAAFALAVPLAGLGFALGARTNVAQVELAVRAAPIRFAPPSLVSKWTHAADVGGHLDAIGAPVFFIGQQPADQVSALQVAARILGDQKRTAEAGRLADRAIEIASADQEFAPSIGGNVQMAVMLSEIGRQEDARPYLRRALARARELRDPEQRALSLAFVGGALGKAGLRSEAREAIDEARASLPASASPSGRSEFDGLLAEALVRAGAVEEAMALIGRESRWPSFASLDALIEGGHLAEARSVSGGADHPLALGMVAAAFAAKGRVEEAKAMTRTALALVDRGPPGRRDFDWSLLHLLLLRMMTAAETAAVVKDRGNPEELAVLAAVLARSGQLDLARETAREAERRAAALPGSADRERVLAGVARALARSGEAESALAAARRIEERELLATALGHAAYGFAAVGQADRARMLVREARAMLPSIADRDQRSIARTAIAMADVRLGRYAAALDDERSLAGADRLAIYTAIISDDAQRRDDRLREALERPPIRDVWRFGLYLP